MSLNSLSKFLYHVTNSNNTGYSSGCSNCTFDHCSCRDCIIQCLYQKEYQTRSLPYFIRQRRQRNSYYTMPSAASGLFHWFSTLDRTPLPAAPLYNDEPIDHTISKFLKSFRLDMAKCTSGGLVVSRDPNSFARPFARYYSKLNKRPNRFGDVPEYTIGISKWNESRALMAVVYDIAPMTKLHENRFYRAEVRHAAASMASLYGTKVLVVTDYEQWVFVRVEGIDVKTSEIFTHSKVSRFNRRSNGVRELFLRFLRDAYKDKDSVYF